MEITKNVGIALVMFTAVLVSPAGASAAVVAEHAGPTPFVGTNFDYVTLADCDIIHEGSIYLEFKPDILNDGYLWSYANMEEPVSAGFYHISVKLNWAGELSVSVTDSGGYVFAGTNSKITLDGQWHRIKVWWKAGETFFMQVDDNNPYQHANYPALKGGSSKGHHELGRNSAYHHPDKHDDMYYDGQIRNVVVTDRYDGPIVEAVHSSGSTVIEEGRGADRFTVVLKHAPRANVTITLDPKTEDIQLVSQAPGAPYDLIFTSDNWNTPQTVTVRATDDALDEELENAWIHLTSASHDSDFADRVMPLIITTVIDNDERKTAFVESGGSTKVSEQHETSDTYTVVISNMEPKSSVEVDIADESNPDQVSISPERLTFTPDNWNVPQTVTVKAIDDGLGEMTHQETILSHTLSSDDLPYNGVVTSLNLTVIDNDIFRMPIIAQHLPVADFDPSAGPPYGKTLSDISLLTEGTVYFEFRVEAVNEESGILWMIDNDQFEMGISVNEAGFVSVNASNKTLGQNLWYDHEPFSDIGPASGWHSIYVSWPRGPKPVDSWGRFVLDGKDVFPSGITNINLNNYDFSGISHSRSAPSTHTIGTNPSSTHHFNGQIRHLLVSNVYIPSLLTVVAHSAGSTEVNEQGKTSDSFSIQLRQAPVADVMLTLDPDTDDIKLESNAPGTPVELVFTPGNWSLPQTVTVSATDDGLIENNDSLLISLSGASADENFHNKAFLPIVVEVLDNDAAN